MLKALVSRYHDLAGDNRMGYIQIFKNWGHGAGIPWNTLICRSSSSPDADGSCLKLRDRLRLLSSSWGFVSYCDLIKFEG